MRQSSLSSTADAHVLLNTHASAAPEAMTDSLDQNNFNGILKLALDSTSILHLVGSKLSYRQAMIAPVVGSSTIGQVFEVRKNCLLNLLIERANGQLLTICILDYRSQQQIDLCSLVLQIETVLPKFGVVPGDTAAQEIAISNAVGCTVSIEEVNLDTQRSGFYSNAIAGLSSSILSQVMAQSPGNTPVPDIELARKRTVEALNQQLNDAREQFLSRLDKNICTAITRSGGELTSRRYNSYSGLGKSLRLRRLQAAQAFPLIGAMQIDPVKHCSFIRRAVDRKLPLIPALAKGLGVPLETVRWLVGKDIQCVGQCWSEHVGELAKSLAVICPEHRPETIQDWTNFSDFLSSVEQLDSRIGGSPFLQKVDITTGLLRQLGKIGWSQTHARFAAIGAAVSDLPDMSDLILEAVQVLAEQIGEGGALTETLHDELVPHIKKLYFGVGISRQLQASLRWHTLMLQPDRPLVENNLVVPTSLHSWSAPFDSPLEIGGVVAVCLTNPQQLRDEGEKMHHCVRNYADYCLYYGSTIISLREVDGTRISTVELCLTENLSNILRFTLRQHRGPKNIHPPVYAELAVKELLSAVNARGAEHRRQQIYKEQNERKVFRRARTCNTIEPRRLDNLKEALRVHVGYDRFYEVALQVVQSH